MKTIIKRTAALILALAVTFAAAFVAGAEEELYVGGVVAQFGQSEAREMLGLINDFRLSDEAWYWNADNATKTVLTDLAPLGYDYELEDAAMRRAAEIGVKFSHTRPDGTLCFSAYSGETYAAGENIAWGYPTFEAAFTAWCENDDPYEGQGHRRNMLSEGFTAVAVGHAVVGGMHCWVQEFRSPLSDAPFTEPLDEEVIAAFEFSRSALDVSEPAAVETDITMKVGDMREFPYLAVNAGGITVYLAECEYSFSDDTVVTVTDDGLLNAEKPGSVVLRLRAMDTESQVRITVVGSDAPAPVGFIPGDVDESGLVDVSDARLALRRAILLETYEPGTVKFRACDASGDGQVTVDDARLILRAAIGLGELS